MGKRLIPIIAVLVTMGGLGCEKSGSYGLHLEFPDDEARQATAAVSLWALEPGGTACGDLLGGAIGPENAKVYAQMRVELPSSGGASLPEVPPGEVLFFAEGEDTEGEVFLRGCVETSFKGGERVEITIHFRRVCMADDDCDDGSVCTADLCVSGECHIRALPDGLSCSDEDPCTTGDACLAGVCSGEVRDCSAFDEQCARGVCNPATTECEAEPLADGTGCDDGLYCTTSDVCQAGVCGGSPMDCDDGQECTRDDCSEGEATCSHVLEPIPGAEGPAGDATCGNGLDDDCDLMVDLNDANCLPCLQDSDCDDANPCTDDTCETDSCLNDPVPDRVDCDDGLYCTVTDRCEAGVCIASQRDCTTFQNQCNVGICREADRTCASAPLGDGTGCQDGDYCSVGDQCTAGVCVSQGQRVCDDSDFCTEDRCDELTDQCTYIRDPRPGEEGPPGDDTCADGADNDCDGLIDLEDGNCFDCVTVLDCDDNNACTLDLCTAGVCSSQPVAPGTSCNDLDACTMVDLCAGDVCSGVPLDEDGDGHIAAVCGGDDCLDSSAAVHPGMPEGPSGSPSCEDGEDNDCDGGTDLTDLDCFEPVCNPEGWCWQNPIPHGNSLSSLHGTAANDVWAVGWNGTIMHWDGFVWTPVASPSAGALYGVWGAGSDEAWAVGGEGVVLRWSALSGRWTEVSSGVSTWMFGIWGLAHDDIWGVLSDGNLIHWDGLDWTLTNTPLSGLGQSVYGIFGLASNDVWAVGTSGFIMRYDGTEWTLSGTTVGAMLVGVWGSSADDVWAVGMNGTILHFDGVTWNSDVESPTTEDLYAVWGFAADDVWAVGAHNTLLHFDGFSWEIENFKAGKSLFFADADELHAIWGSAPDDVWAVGAGGITLHYDGQQWVDRTQGTTRYLWDVWGASVDALWAVGGGGTILRYDPATASWSEEASGVGSHLFGIWGASGTDVWAVGENQGDLTCTILHSDGTDWIRHSCPIAQTQRSVWSAGTDLVWSVGEMGTILRYESGSWSPEISPVTEDLNGVWGYDRDQVVAVGNQGVILRYNGTDWIQEPSPTSENLHEVFGFGEDLIIAVGDCPGGGEATVVVYDGVSWELSTPGIPVSLYGVWGVDAFDSYLVGDYGTIFHTDGALLNTEAIGLSSRLRSVWGFAGVGVWAVGRNGAIVHKPLP